MLNDLPLKIENKLEKKIDPTANNVCWDDSPSSGSEEHSCGILA